MRPAAWIGLFVLLAAGWGSIATLGDDPDAGAGPAEANASSERPLDPEGPWTVGPYDARVSVAGQGLELVGPVVAEADRGLVDSLLVVAPDGTPLAGVDCRGGSCRVQTPLGTREVPAATLAPEGAWQQGQLTGVSLTAADGRADATIDATGEQGVRLRGQALDQPVTVTSTLVVEGTPRDVDRLALRGPSGDVLLVAEPAGHEPGRVHLLDRTVEAPNLHVELVGDPLSDDEVRVRLWVRGDRTGFVVHQTPAEAYGRAGQALDEHLVLASPTRAREANVTLAAGPVQLSGSGSLSTRFDVRTTVRVPNASGYDRGRLTVDGQPRALLDLAGYGGDERVLHGRLAAGGLSAGGHEVSVRLERDVAPGIVQTQRTANRTVLADREGPGPPTGVSADDGELVWSKSQGAEAYQVRAIPPEGPERMLPVDGTSADLPASPPGVWTGQVRGVDAVGNPGPWGPETEWTVDEGGGEASKPAFSFELEEPREGETLVGTERVRWVGQSVSSVRVDVRSAGGGGDWTRVAQGSDSPLSWDTRTVLDGRYRLRATADGPEGPQTRLTTVTVDNLAEVTEQTRAGMLARDADPGSAPELPGPLPGRPLPTALAVALGAAGALGLGVAKLRGSSDRE